MTMIACRECRAPVTAQALRCMQCGAPVLKSSKLPTIIAVIVGLALCVGLVWRFGLH